MMDDQAIAARIEDYTALYDRQIEQAGGWPASFVFPQPASPLDTKRCGGSLRTSRPEPA